MNIREKIGGRIIKARKELGITIKELASRTKEFSAARISNWENGARSPGPIEALLLAEQLKVSASYLLCLTDDPLGERILDLRKSVAARPIPLLRIGDTLHAKEIIDTKHSGILEENENCVIIDRFTKFGENSLVYALTIEDESMAPDFNESELIVIDTERKVTPGNFVLAYLTERKQVVLRKYCETDIFSYQLLASNPMWATINVKDHSEVQIIGTVIEHRRFW